jgi:thiol:disulfide interchange protein DsbC
MNSRTWRTFAILLAALAALSAASWAYLNRPGHGGFVFAVEQRLNRVFHFDTRTADFRELPLGDAIRTVSGNGSRVVVVFSDPYCPYCKDLERTLGTAHDLTVYTFLYPILTPGSKTMSARVWCSGDRSATWSHWMLDGVEPAAASSSCDAAALERNFALGRKLGVVGTPTLMFPDGKRMNRVPTAQELAQALGGGAPSPAGPGAL